MDYNDLNILLIFIKNPEYGKVKTRLGRSIGPDKAYQVYQQLLELTKQETQSLSCHKQLWYSDYIDNNDRWDSSHYEKKVQSGRDLGERMEKAFKQVFAEGFTRAVIIGSDCAELKKEHINDAFTALTSNDVAIGPSEDGGYYLLGMSEYYPTLFDSINWSTPTVFEDTIIRVKELSLSYRILPELNDIDTKEDLLNSGQRLKNL